MNLEPCWCPAADVSAEHWDDLFESRESNELETGKAVTSCEQVGNRNNLKTVKPAAFCLSFFLCSVFLHSEILYQVLFWLLIKTCGFLKGPVPCYLGMFVRLSVWGYSHASINGWPQIVKGSGRRCSFSVVVVITSSCQDTVQEVYCCRANTVRLHLCCQK